MKKKYKIITVAVVVSVVVVAVSVTVPLLVLEKKHCPETCSMTCGVTCMDNPRCVGTACDDPSAVCDNGICVVKHSCSPSGECVPDPNGPFKGNTCTCFSVSSVGDECVLAGNEGEYKSVTACEARDSDYQCVPGTGTCERVIGSTTGWKSEEDCKCFECNSELTCVPSLGVNSPTATDGEGCLACGLWKCTEGGGCAQAATGGNWEKEEQCACGLCGEDGSCLPTESGGAYRTVSECEMDDGAMCKDPTLGWACDTLAGNEETCRQALGGSAATLEDCNCWTCAGTPPGPTSLCVFDAGNTGEFDTHSECLFDDEKKCGWKYMCA